jgi:3-oxoacyl-[acyl-carrier-protein] synthase II
MNHRSPEIVITAAGLATGLGLSREQTWRAVLQGRCAMGPMSALESPLPPGKDGGQALDLPAEFAPDLPREARYLKWTLAAALREAGIENALPCDPDRCACLLGTTLHGMRSAGRFLRSNNYAQLRQFLAGDILALAAGGAAFTGLSATTCSACSSSLGSIALGITMLQGGDADLVIAGGYDTISEYVYAGFNGLRLVADGPLRPFARDRQGMKLAEGYGLVVLERAGDAARRGATPLAAILGWGESADAHHLTQPHPLGEGAARAMTEALARAGLKPAEIDLIAAHATGTPDNDGAEFAAFSRVFGQHLPNIPAVAFKSHLGHTLGGAGAVELVLSAMALRDQVIPSCVNVTAGEVEFPDLRLAVGIPRAATVRATLNTSLGFGGANTCMVLGPAPATASASTTVKSDAPMTVTVADRLHAETGTYDGPDRIDQASPTPTRSRDVFITGIGVVFPGIVGNDALLARLAAADPPAWVRETGAVPESDLAGLLAARRTRRMSDYVKLSLAATTLACRDAGLTDIPEFARTCAAVLGSTHGSANFSLAFYSQIVKEGLAAANPILFAESVPNAAAAQLSLMLSLKGACQTVIGTRTAGLDAIALAAARIRGGVWDRAIVSAGDEHCDVVNEAYRQCGVAAREGCAPFSDEPGFVSGAGAVTFILESRESVESRGGRVRGRVDAVAARRGAPASAGQTAVQVLEALDCPDHIMSSACGTWIDRAEAAAIRRSVGVRTVSAIYGHIAETYSASPLAAVAAVLLSGKLPRLLGGAWEGPVQAAAGEERVGSFASLCTDFTGCVSGVLFSAG